MKPSFALDFRDGVVTLLHRTSRGWSQVGSTSFDAPDFVEALSYLRSTALGLSPRGITTKLIIPNDQILYHQAYAPGPEPAKRKRQIRTALEGLTPYALDELVYDWWGTGPDLQVAVVAKETLAEAEAFATEHRFNPVSFVGVPENGAFLGEPFFGPTAASVTLLAEGEKVERDPDPVTIIVRDFPQSEPAAPAARRAPDPASESAAVSRRDPEPATSSRPNPASADLPSAAPKAPPQVDEAAAVGQAAVGQAAVKAEAEFSRPAVSDSRPASRPEAAEPAPLPTPPPARTAPPAAPPQPASARVTEPQAKSAPVAASWPLEMARPAQSEPQPKGAEPKPGEIRPATQKPGDAKVTASVPEAPMAMDVAPEPATPGNDDDIPAAPAADIVAAFASRRTAAIAAATAGTTKAVAAPASKIPPVGAAPGLRPTVPRPSMARPAAGPGTRETVPFLQKSPATPKPAINKSGKPVGAFVTAPGILGVKRERNVVPLPTAGSPEAQEATARRSAATPGLGLGSKAAAVKAKPKYLGLILTVILLLLLAAVAAWSSFFMVANDSSGTGAGSAPVAGSAALIAPATAPQTSAPDAAAATTGQNASVATDATSVANATAVAPDVTAPAPEQGQTAATTTPPAPTADYTAPADQTAQGEAPADAAAAGQTATAGSSAPAVTPSDTAVASPDTAVASATPQDPAASAPASVTSMATTSDAAPPLMAANSPSASTMSAPATPDAGNSAVATGDAASTTAALPPATPEVTAISVEPAPKTEVTTAGIAALQPPGTSQDSIVVANADTAPTTPGLMRLPALVSGADASPSAALPPPPYGTIYKFDAEGRIVPTPEGILTPEGVLLVAGKPKVLPPDRPADLTPKAQPDSAQAAQTQIPQSQTAQAQTDAAAAATGPSASSAAVPAGNAATTDIAAPPSPAASSLATAASGPAANSTAASLPQDPTLRGKRPKDRPANLTPPPDPQGALPDARADNGLASLRPQARPAGMTSPIAADTGADVSTASASLAANGFVLTSSPKPPARPANLKPANLKTTNLKTANLNTGNLNTGNLNTGNLNTGNLNTGNLNTAVNQAVEVALNQPATGAASNQIPDAEAEPDVEASAPNLPTNASVAKQATTRHALNGSKVALLAVFGSSSTRFAMVRQANGAVKKVQVGDNVDGGRIGAITDNSVQYSKGGRIMTLSMPAG